MAAKFIRSQFRTLPVPTHSFAGQTVIVTGANVGLGFEAVQHFVRLGANKVILACRSVEKGKAAVDIIEKATKRKNVCEVWQVDMGDWGSIKAFATRAGSLDRVDAVVESAGVGSKTYKEVAGMEAMIAINVVGTFLLALNLLPILRTSGRKHNTISRLSVVTSGAHGFAKFNEQNAASIFEELKKDDPKYMDDRYNTSKLLEVFGVLSMTDEMKAGPNANQKIIINLLEPGFCKSELTRDVRGMQLVIYNIMKAVLARTTEVGSRNLVAAAAAGEETHGGYIQDCHLDQVAAVVRTDKAKKTQDRVWTELKHTLEEIQPGITKMI